MCTSVKYDTLSSVQLRPILATLHADVKFVLGLLLDLLLGLLLSLGLGHRLSGGGLGGLLLRSRLILVDRLRLVAIGGRVVGFVTRLAVEAQSAKLAH